MSGYYLGLDAGSTYLKAVLIRDGHVVDVQVLPTGIDSEKTAGVLLLWTLWNYSEICKEFIQCPEMFSVTDISKFIDMLDDDCYQPSICRGSGAGKNLRIGNVDFFCIREQIEIG